MSDHLEAAGQPRGFVTDSQTMYGLSSDWYRGRMDEDWQPWTPEEAEAIFASHGLTGEFWKVT